MEGGQLNRIAAIAPILMSAAALALVLVALLTGWERDLKDEGVVAHTWQLLVGFQLPLIVMFLITANWSSPRRTLIILATQGAGLVLAMAPVAYFHL